MFKKLICKILGHYERLEMELVYGGRDEKYIRKRCGNVRIVKVR